MQLVKYRLAKFYWGKQERRTPFDIYVNDSSQVFIADHCHLNITSNLHGWIRYQVCELSSLHGVLHRARRVMAKMMGLVGDKDIAGKQRKCNALTLAARELRGIQRFNRCVDAFTLNSPGLLPSEWRVDWKIQREDCKGFIPSSCKGYRNQALLLWSWWNAFLVHQPRMIQTQSCLSQRMSPTEGTKQFVLSSESDKKRTFVEINAASVTELPGDHVVTGQF